MRRLIAVLFLMLTVVFACNRSNREDAAPAPAAKPAVKARAAVPALSDAEVATLLAEAQRANPQSGKAEKAVLSADEIRALQARVVATESIPVQANEVALLETSLGPIAITFFTDVAPKHAESFKRLINAGFYNGTRFHRIIDNFMIQGGDILTRDSDPENDGTGGPGYSLKAEFNAMQHDLGVLSMARSQDPNSAGSQFFICLSRNGTRSLDGKYTVFGKVIGGLDVVKALGKVPVRPSRRGENSVPVEPVYIKQAYMVTR